VLDNGICRTTKAAKREKTEILVAKIGKKCAKMAQKEVAHKDMKIADPKFHSFLPEML
jgi:hypothetical protein